MIDRSEERPLFIAPEEIGVGLAPNGNVMMIIGPPHPSLGFSVGIVLAVELTPAESRDLASRLEHKAREAEGGGIPS